MAWSDEPTEPQLEAIYRLIRWNMPNAEAIRACNWLKDNTTRRDVSYEMKRLRELYINHKLTRNRCFEGEIWEGYHERI